MKFRLMTLTIFALLVIPGTLVWAQPSIEFEKRSYDFGTSYSHQTLNHDFVFTNTGDKLLEITRTTKSCGCTAAVVSPTAVIPSATGIVSVTLTTSFPGKKQEAVTVHCNDPANPEIRISVSTTITNLWSFSPKSSFFLNSVPINSERSMQLFMKNIKDEPFKILATQVKKPELSVQIGKPLEDRVPIILTVKADSKKGMITDMLEIRTDHPKQPVTRISIAARIVGHIQFSRKRIFFKNIEPGQTKELEITANIPLSANTEELMISEITSDKKLVTGKVLGKRPDGTTRILFTFVAPEKQGYHSGTIKLKTNIEAEPETTLPYSALVRSSKR